MYKIRPSQLEDFRIMRADIFDKDPADLIARIKGEFTPTASMSLGSAIHAYLETGTDTGELMGEEMEQLKMSSLKFAGYQHEVAFKTALTDSIMVSGKLDLLAGRAGGEIKTGSRFYGVDFYDSSLQWKLYSAALNLSIFKYFHIQISGTKRPHRFSIREFAFYPYPDMKKEVISECEGFIEFCLLNNLEKYITYE